MPIIDNCRFIGDESETNEYEKEYLWIVDPIDSKEEFFNATYAKAWFLHSF